MQATAISDSDDDVQFVKQVPPTHIVGFGNFIPLRQLEVRNVKLATRKKREKNKRLREAGFLPPARKRNSKKAANSGHTNNKRKTTEPINLDSSDSDVEFMDSSNKNVTTVWQGCTAKEAEGITCQCQEYDPNPESSLMCLHCEHPRNEHIPIIFKRVQPEKTKKVKPTPAVPSTSPVYTPQQTPSSIPPSTPQAFALETAREQRSATPTTETTPEELESEYMNDSSMSDMSDVGGSAVASRHVSVKEEQSEDNETIRRLSFERSNGDEVQEDVDDTEDEDDREVDDALEDTNFDITQQMPAPLGEHDWKNPPPHPRYPKKLPYYTCPPQLAQRLKSFGFRKRVAIEKVVSIGDLKWEDFDEELLNRLARSPTVDQDFINAMFDKIGNRKNLAGLHRLSQESTEFALKTNQVVALNAKVQNGSIVFEGPYLEQSNRVIREFGFDRFLRVDFDTYDFKQTTTEQKKNVFRTVLHYGIVLAGRHFEFLCFSASQLRESKCYFFASRGEDIHDNVTAESVRRWLGDFSNCKKSLAKYAARLGQPFSKTLPTIVVPLEHVQEIPDIEDKEKDWNWTDGCGEMSPDYMEKIAQAMKLSEVPSAFQVRFGAIKGVFAVNPKLKETILYRPSMKKYDIPNPTDSQRTIEVIKYSSSARGFLNRQFITLLSSLGVPNEVFLDLEHKYMDQLLSMTNTTLAAKACIGDKQNELESPSGKAFAMLAAGHSVNDPYLHSLLVKIRESTLMKVKDKHKVMVPNSALLIGVCDQTSLLKSGQVFIQLSLGYGRTQVLSNKITVSKNPCVHPGDFRVLECVDIPELHHLRDVIVFPTQMDTRPHTNMIAGSDLDGDLYFATWDQRIVNAITEYEPMNYSNEVKPKPVPEHNTIEAVKDHFLDSIFSTALGIIALNHQALADQWGAKDPRCLRLASYFSRAVDAAKTGDQVTLPPGFTTRDFPSYMDLSKEGVKRGYGKYYESSSILGLMHANVKKRIQTLQSETEKEQISIQPDPVLLVEGREKYMPSARATLKYYGQEMAEAMQLPDEQRQELADKIIKRYRKRFLEENDAVTYEERLMKASAWYSATYEHAQKTYANGLGGAPPTTFAWNTCDDYLNRLKAEPDVLKKGSNARLSLSFGHSMLSSLRIK